MYDEVSFLSTYVILSIMLKLQVTEVKLFNYRLGLNFKNFNAKEISETEVTVQFVLRAWL